MFGRHLGRSTSLESTSITAPFLVNNTVGGVVESRRTAMGQNYDKKILLEPNAVEYKYNDSQFLPGPSFADEPYIKPTDEEMIELTRIKMENEIVWDSITKVDPNSAPFNEILEGVDDGGRFTQVEKIP